MLTGCAVEADVPEASPTPRSDLAAKAEVAAKNKGTASAAKGSDKQATAKQRSRNGRDRARDGSGTVADRSPDSSAGTRGGSSGGRAEGAAEGGSADWSQLASTADSSGDHGNGPGYADITELTIKDSGEHAMLAVTVADVLPGRLVTGEVQGVGVDLYRSDDQESDYQVFFDGGTHGWRAFLQTPEGFVEFPGSFAVQGRTLTATVPWSALGGREGASVSAFADWSSGVGRLSADGVPTTEVSPG